MGHWIRLIVIVIAATPFFASAQSDTQSTGIVKEFIATLNENDKPKTEEYIVNNYISYFLEAFPLENHVNFATELHRQNGNLIIESITQLPDHNHFARWAALVNSERTEEWNELIVFFIAEKPGKIAGIQIRPASISSIPEFSTNISQRKLKKELKAYLKRAEEKDVFSGTVLLAKDNTILFTGVAGAADKRFDTPINIHTRFNLGSMNKMFTAVAIMQLVQEGRLHLDDRLNTFIDDSWLPLEISRKIQIQHLLSHTSGLGSYFNHTYESSAKDSFRHLEDYKVLIKDDTLQFEPGTAYAYSNTGMFLLGLVIEKVSGEDYFDYIRTHIYQPASMNNSDSFDLDQPTPNLATGYYVNPDSGAGWTNNNMLLPAKGCPAGGGYSTVEDLYKFVLALTGNKLLQKPFTDQLLVAHPELGASDYGFGFQISGDDNNRIVGHSGGFEGISANLDIYLDKGYVAIVLSNYSGGAPPVMQKLRILVEQATHKNQL